MAAKKRRDSEVPETDRLAGFPHPRETSALLGHEEVLARAARAIRSGRPPQGWLITGPPGIGKATFAYRVARYLLVYGATERGPADLSVPSKDSAAIQVSAGSHSGLLALRRSINPDTGRLMNVISVNEVRKLGAFFGMTSGAGGWRVAIVDTADDMNDNAANAILKLLEEPPARALLLLLANVPGRLLPTIRSRCQRFDLRPLSPSLVEGELEKQLPDLATTKRAALARLSGGSIGLALQLASGDGVMLAEEADRLIKEATRPDIPALLSFGDRLFRITDGIETFGAFLKQALADRIRARAHEGAANLDLWLQCYEKLNASFEQTSLLHLDARQTVLSAAGLVSSTVRRAGSV